MTVRPIAIDDANDVSRICFAQGLPVSWAWPSGHAGIVAEHGGRVVAFAALTETPYGIVVGELWEEESPIGVRGLGLLRRHIEGLAQALADERGEPLEVGGVVRLDRERHINALWHRGYKYEGVVLGKVFQPHDAGA